MESLDRQEVEIIGVCHEAVVQGPFLLDRQADDPWWEIPEQMGRKPEEVADIAGL